MVLLVATPPISGVPGTHSPPVTSMCAKTQKFLFKCLSCLLTAYQCILTHKKSHKITDICVGGCQSVMLLSRMFGHSLENFVIYEWPMVITHHSKHTIHIVIFNQVQSLLCQKQTPSPRIFCPFEYFDFSSVLWWPSHLNLIYCVFSIVAQTRSNLCHRWEFSNWWALSAKIQWATNFSISLTLDIFHWLPRILLHSGENGKDREATYIYVL